MFDYYCLGTVWCLVCVRWFSIGLRAWVLGILLIRVFVISVFCFDDLVVLLFCDLAI